MKQNISDCRRYRTYGIIGMVGLFFMGILVGITLKNSFEEIQPIMTQEQCYTIYDRMDSAINGFQYESYENLRKIFVKNCNGYNIKTLKTKSEAMVLEKTEEADFREQHTAVLTTCEKIEKELLGRLFCWGNAGKCNAFDHVREAQTYANLSEHGCAQNSEKYKSLAKQELDIANALNDDGRNAESYETREIVETYKRLQLQKEAEKIIDKAKKLTNPAIDFIMELEKIIEE